MKYSYEQPREIVIIFTPIDEKHCKHPLHIEKCVGMKTGKEIVIEYLARDNKVHRHKYYHKHIKLISSKEEVIYESKLRKH